MCVIKVLRHSHSRGHHDIELDMGMNHTGSCVTTSGGTGPCTTSGGTKPWTGSRRTEPVVGLNQTTEPYSIGLERTKHIHWGLSAEYGRIKWMLWRY